MLQLTTEQRSAIAAHGKRDYPQECCGLLLGRFEKDGRKVCAEIYPISNAREEEAKRNRFLIRPQELLRGEQYAAAKGLNVVGFYHSHPDHPAVPSAYDLEHAWPVYSYIVVAVKSGNAEELRCWEMQADRTRFAEEEILKGNKMSVTIAIPTALRNFAGGQSRIELQAATAGEALDRLTSQFAELRRHLYDDQNKLRNFVNVYVNDDDIRHRSGAETPLKDGDSLMIVPSIAGGSTAEAEVAKELPVLSNEEIARYSRHLIMPEVGLEGQKRLKAARVLMIGTGGLGAPLGMYLAAAGVGRLGLVDFDVVDSSNLQRQIVHGTKDVGRRKVDSARERLADINPHIEIETHDIRLTSDNALALFKNYDIIVDGTDNFPTRYLVNDACVLTGKPNVYGSIFRFEGQASVFWSERGACYRCLYPEPPPPGLVPSCAEGGVLGVLPGIVGAIQANETIKLILGAEDTLVNRLLLFDAWHMKFREFKLRKDPNCPVCGENPTIKELIDYEQFCGLAPSQQVAAPQLDEITATKLKQRLDRGDDLQIIDVREPHEFEIARIPHTKLIPLAQVVNRMNEIDPSRETVMHCKAGVRSAKAIQALKQAGFKGELINLKGGITAWSDEVDPQVAKY